MYDIHIADQQSLLHVDEDALIDVVVKTLRAEEIAAAEISIALVDDATIHELNRNHLQHDYPTDVLSFLFDCETAHNGPAEDKKTDVPRGRNKRIDGEVVVSTETAIAQSQEYGFPPLHEVVLYVVHGLLHLAGYDDLDETESQVMRAREKTILHLCELSPGVRP